MDRRKLVSHLLKTLARICRILISIEQRVRHEQRAFRVAEKTADLGFGMIQITTAVECRVADQKNAPGFVVGKHFDSIAT